MANKRWDAFRGSIGFYTTMAVCLVAIGVSGYFLLTDRQEDAPPQEQEDIPHTEVLMPEIPDLDLTEEIPVAGTLPPDPVKVELLPDPAPVPEPEAEPEPKDKPVNIVVDDVPVVAEAPRLIVSPLKGEVLAVFSVDELIYNETLADWRTHDGVDIAAAVGTTVMAACAGTVAAVFSDSMMGTTVVLDHAGGYQTTYANLQPRPTVEVGDTVSAGQIIGAVGTTAPAESAQAPHLHFAVTKHGDVVDPDEFLNR